MVSETSRFTPHEPLSGDDRYWLEKLIADVESPEQRPYITGFAPMRLDFMARMLRRALEAPVSEIVAMPDEPTGAMLGLIAGEDQDPPLRSRDNALVVYKALRALTRQALPSAGDTIPMPAAQDKRAVTAPGAKNTADTYREPVAAGSHDKYDRICPTCEGDGKLTDTPGSFKACTTCDGCGRVVPASLALSSELENPWTEEEKARLDLALCGKTDKPLAWIRADGLLIASKEEADKQVGYKVHPLYAHPSAMGTTKAERIERAYCAANDYINVLLNPNITEEKRAEFSKTYWQRVGEV